MESDSESVPADIPDELRPLAIPEDFASEDDDDSDEGTSLEDPRDNVPVTEAATTATLSWGRPSHVAEEESLVGSSLAEVPTDLENCLAFNHAYQALLADAITELTERLESNRQLQKELPAQLSGLFQKPKLRVRRNWYQSLVFHYPYFRDINGMRAPMNEDEKIKRANKELDPYLAPSRPWTVEENQMLVKAVKNNLLQQSLESLMDRKEALAQKVLETEDPEQRAELATRMAQLDEQVSETHNLTLEELLEQSSRPIDWLRIAAADMNADRTAFGCEMRWRNLLDVRLNQGPWTSAEDERLRTFVAKYGEHNWDKIAEEMKSGRSAFQCATHYSSKLVTRHNSGTFSDEENHKLQQLVAVCAKGDDIPWAQVSHFMDSRSKKQVMNRYNRSLHPKIQHGRWTAQEDLMMLIAVASMLPGRTGGQCRERYLDNFAQQYISEPYAPDEDYTLLELVKKHGVGRWAKIAEEMPWRTANAALMRYRQLSEALGIECPTVDDLQRSLTTPAGPVTSARCARLSGMDKRLNLYRRISRLLSSQKMKRAAMLLVKGRDESLDRDTCLRLYDKIRRHHQGGSVRSSYLVQSRCLNKAIAQYAQPLRRPMLPSLAAYEHQEWHAVGNVLHDLHGLPRPPPDPDVEEAGTVPIFEEFFSKEVLGVPEEFDPKIPGLLLPLFPANETTVASFGSFSDRFANGKLMDSLPTLRADSKYPELSAVLDADSLEEVRCTECTSRSLLELSSTATCSMQETCGRCAELQTFRLNYEVLQSRFIAYFFYPALMDTMNVCETVELPLDKKKKCSRRPRKQAKLRKPWVKEKWKERRRLAAEAAAAATAATAATSGDSEAPKEPSAGPASGASANAVA
ncbi:hypothetical protein HPB50_027730 [Hyalomma asiaticum]|nr:hypothetical protein HPB50_027730 [Hyalomma asiaticum]